MNEVEAVALKPCPFCAAPAEIEQGSDHHGEWFNLGCSRHWGKVKDPNPSNTCIAGRMFYTEIDRTEAEAISAWNTRAALDAARGDQVARVVEWLRNGGGTDISQLNGSMQMLFLEGMNRYADAIERGEPFRD